MLICLKSGLTKMLISPFQAKKQHLKPINFRSKLVYWLRIANKACTQKVWGNVCSVPSKIDQYLNIPLNNIAIFGVSMNNAFK